MAVIRKLKDSHNMKIYVGVFILNCYGLIVQRDHFKFHGYGPATAATIRRVDSECRNTEMNVEQK